MAEDRNILIMFGMVAEDPIIGDYVLIEYGKNKGKIIQVKKIVMVPDKFHDGKLLKLIIGSSGISIPAGACSYYRLCPYKKSKKGIAS